MSTDFISTPNESSASGAVQRVTQRTQQSQPQQQQQQQQHAAHAPQQRQAPQQREAAYACPQRAQSRACWRVLQLAAVMLLLLASAQLTVAQTSLQQYPIDWSTINNATSTAGKDLYAPGCPCSLHSSTCTPHCCCDGNCPWNFRQQFQSSGVCLLNETQVDNLAYCTDQGFAKINLPSKNYYWLQKKVADSDFMTQTLCIKKDNNPSLGLQYADPTPGASNAQLTQCPTAFALPSNNAVNFTFGDTIMLDSISGNRSAFMLPAPALTAECAFVQPLGFMVRVPADLTATLQTCQRTIRTAAELNATCVSDTDIWSPNHYTSLQFPIVATAVSTVGVNISNLTYVQPGTGAVNSNNQTAATPVFVAGPPGACTKAVVRADYTFTYALDDQGDAALLTGVAVALTTSDVSMPAGGGPLVVPYQISVSWAPEAATPAQLMSFSGSPGYLSGYPVLAGLQTTQGNQSAVSRFRQGLLLPGPGLKGQCNSRDLGPLGFGYNSSTSCSVPLTLAALNSYCTGSSPGALLSQALGGYLDNITQGSVMVGVWGNSDIGNVNEWVPLVVQGWPSQPLSWDDSSSSCSNVMTGFNIQLVTGLTYANGGIQSKVLYAQLCFTTTTWSWPSSSSSNSSQQFTLNFTAQFIALPQAGPREQVRPMPPLFMPLPPDIFYPFLTNGSTALAGPWVLMVQLVAAAVAVLFLL